VGGDVVRLLTTAIERQIPPLYSTENVPLAEKVIVAKFFHPCGRWTWYVVEGEPTEDGDWLFFGLVQGHETEWGYFTLAELESARGPLGLGIERDLYFEPGPIGQHAQAGRIPEEAMR
jgi:hypothetical protein